MSTVCFVFRPRRRVAGKLRVAANYSGKLRMPWESGNPSVFALGTSDKRIAQQILNEKAKERHLERQGLLAPKEARDAAETPLLELVSAYLADRRVKGCSVNTVAKYESNLTTLAKACAWSRICDVTARSFLRWRADCGLSPKSMNDVLANARGFLEWLWRQRMVTENALDGVDRSDTRLVKRFRRALTEKEQRALVAKSPHFRAVIYLLVLETGLRRNEVNGLRVRDFVLDTPAPFIRLSAELQKNRKACVIRLRPVVVDAVRSVFADHALPDEWVFHNRVPRISTMARDLNRAGIAFETPDGRVDLHALRVTFCTNLLNAGVHPRVVQELMRHSDIKLTMRNYTDETQLPVAAALGQLPKISLGTYTQKHTHGVRPEGPAASEMVAGSLASEVLQSSG